MFGSPHTNHLSTRFAPFRAEIDHPIRSLDDIEIVFNHQNRIARLDKIRQYLKEHFDICEMEAGRWLIEQVERFSSTPFHKFPGQLDPLGFPSRERRRRLAEFHVVQPDIVQSF